MRTFGRDLSSIAGPLGVEGAGFVGAVVGVGAEEVALGLDETLRQTGAACARARRRAGCLC